MVQYDKSTVALKKFDTDKLKDYRNNSDFDYTEYQRETTIVERIWYWLKRMLQRFLTWIFGAKKALGIVAVIFRILPYLILIIALFFLIKLFLKINFNELISGKTATAEVTLTEDEEIIKNKDIQQLIKKAIAQKNYRLAVRYYYLLVLQKLQENNLIEWEPQKTNEDYIVEIQNKKIISKFKEVTYLYDFVWYGNFEINELEFDKVAINFEKLTTNIK